VQTSCKPLHILHKVYTVVCPTRYVESAAAQVPQRTSSSPRAKWNNTHACLQESYSLRPYYVLFGALVQQSHIRRRRAVARPCARPRPRQSFDELQASLSQAEFTRAFRMSLETYANFLSLLKLDLTPDMRIASRSGGRGADPEVRLALTIRMLSRTSFLDLMMLFRVASSTIYDVFHRTIASIIKRIPMPGLPFQQNELQNLAPSFTSSRQPSSVHAVHVVLSRAPANKASSVYGMACNIYHIGAMRANFWFCMERP
jgi:hypothetical protein